MVCLGQGYEGDDDPTEVLAALLAEQAEAEGGPDDDWIEDAPTGESEGMIPAAEAVAIFDDVPCALCQGDNRISETRYCMVCDRCLCLLCFAEHHSGCWQRADIWGFVPRHTERTWSLDGARDGPSNVTGERVRGQDLLRHEDDDLDEHDPEAASSEHTGQSSGAIVPFECVIIRPGQRAFAYEEIDGVMVEVEAYDLQDPSYCSRFNPRHAAPAQVFSTRCTDDEETDPEDDPEENATDEVNFMHNKQNSEAT